MEGCEGKIDWHYREEVKLFGPRRKKSACQSAQNDDATRREEIGSPGKRRKRIPGREKSALWQKKSKSRTH